MGQMGPPGQNPNMRQGPGDPHGPPPPHPHHPHHQMGGPGPMVCSTHYTRLYLLYKFEFSVYFCVFCVQQYSVYIIVCTICKQGPMGHGNPNMGMGNPPGMPGQGPPPPNMQQPNHRMGPDGMPSGMPGGPMPNVSGAKIPDENLTPQQRMHREEQLAKMRTMQKLLFPENDHPPHPGQGPGPGQDPNCPVPCHPGGPPMDMNQYDMPVSTQ